MQSASVNATQAPVASRRPVLRAAGAPPFLRRTRRTGKAAATDAVSSVDPSSTTMVSKARSRETLGPEGGQALSQRARAVVDGNHDGHVEAHGFAAHDGDTC
jgi:hypothetical protein